MRYTVGLGLLAIALLAGCGASTPLTATISETYQYQHGATDTETHTWQVSDSARAEALYQHILALPVVPPNTYSTCTPSSTMRSIQFTFQRGSQTTLSASGQCSGALTLSTGTARFPDAALWTLVNQDTGTTLVQP